MKTIIYKDNKGEFRWKIKADNGEIIGASSEGFSSKQALEKNISLLSKALLFEHPTNSEEE